MPADFATDLRHAFTAAFGRVPAVIARAPGRVNLIGEHTDYSHLPVLPMAIDRALFIAAAPTDAPLVEVRSIQFAPPAQIDRGHEGSARAETGWHAYVAGVLQELRDIASGRGAQVLVTGDLPPASGLSSSSALTVGLMAALNAAWEGGLEPAVIARRAAAAERHVGVETGGMDQAVITLAVPGAALRIDFEPFAVRPVALPEGLAVVVASSGEEAPKGGAARDAYNERVVGARLAAAMLAEQIGLEHGTPPRLRDVWGADAVDILIDELPEQISVREVARSVDIDAGQLARLSAGTIDVQKRVPVRRPARHILSEADRVDAAEAALRAADIDAFGQLLNESHDSLRNDFRCSTPALDRLCAAMRKAGALGARLTGAGWGGFAVAVARPEQVAAIIDAATVATGGPAFEVQASAGLELL
jgi:galactokinase